MTKTIKIIIPVAAVIVAAIVAVVCLIIFRPSPVSADKSNPPTTIPSGNYYIDGNPENDELYLVVDGGNIRFANKDNNLREGFKAVNLKSDPSYAEDPDRLESQLDADMEDWGADNYTYKTKWFPGTTDYFMVMFSISENEDGTLWNGQGLSYYPNTNTLHGWEGDYILTE